MILLLKNRHKHFSHTTTLPRAIHSTNKGSQRWLSTSPTHSASKLHIRSTYETTAHSQQVRKLVVIRSCH